MTRGKINNLSLTGRIPICRARGRQSENMNGIGRTIGGGRGAACILEMTEIERCGNPWPPMFTGEWHFGKVRYCIYCGLIANINIHLRPIYTTCLSLVQVSY